MNFESFFDKILIFYKVKTVTDLADKLNVTRSTVSGWKNRQATGAILEFLFNNDLNALHYIFSSDASINNFQNSNNKVSGNGALIDNSNNKSNSANKKEENTNIPQSITIELNSLFERLEDKDEKFIKNITYKIEDFISEIKKETRD
ncbi:helix-turn-helix domain-containing protein [Aliarcobacter butzleri]|uniref:helix-turn-helix domain-containing protein n=1 Tax=Aliarcobacter butzleri TaxID=28197 RepID=UPI0021B205E8|nr:helix-turn-helix domain-containing protein [Aliarcobacter butzleri]MCT7575312.1 helix-turn-helix domain-containing protein [Aliarcobacter butzleri]MCT7608766.1 helix-turn-helix domain-containing protein [Aliarcobacter butzleri]